MIQSQGPWMEKDFYSSLPTWSYLKLVWIRSKIGSSPNHTLLGPVPGIWYAYRPDHIDIQLHLLPCTDLCDQRENGARTARGRRSTLRLISQHKSNRTWEGDVMFTIGRFVGDISATSTHLRPRSHHVLCIRHRYPSGNLEKSILTYTVVES